MSSDQGHEEPRAPRPDLALPRIVSTSSRLIRFEPTRRNFPSALSEVGETVEIAVVTDAPIPIRALGPVLYVGDIPFTEVQADDDTHYRFVAVRPGGLLDGAPITLAWSGNPLTQRVETDQTFQAPEGWPPG